MNIYFRRPSYQQVLFQGIISIIIGSLLLFNSQITIDYIIRFFGFVLLALVFFNLVTAYMSNRKSKDSTLITIGGGIMLIGGIMLLFFPELFKVFIFKFIGVILFLAGVSQIYVAIQVKYLRGLAWINFVIGAIIIIGSIFIVFRPKEAADITVKLIGIFILLHGFSELFLSSRIKAAKKSDPNYVEDVDHTEV